MERSYIWAILGVFIVSTLTCIQSAPRDRTQQQAGPCIGMDCLHGVMMHGDGKQGDNHKAEDTFERLNRQDGAKQSSSAGPCKGLDCLHDIMHEGEDGVKTMHQKIGPEQKGQEGPEHGMEYMHGVLMHGDEQPGKTHKLDDEPQKKSPEHPPDGPCVDCLEDRLHSTHLDKDTEDETEVPIRSKSGTSDPDKLLHGEGVDHTAKKDAKTQENKLSGVSDPDAMMHTDGAKHTEKEQKEVKHPKSVAMDPDKLLHAKGDHHGDDKSVDQKDKAHPKSGTYDPEAILHGGDADHIHDPSNTHKDPDTKLKFGTFDPDVLLHGGKEHEHDKKNTESTDQRKVLQKHEENDFKKWIKSKLSGADSSGSGEGSGGGSWGFSFPYISDTLMDEIEQMKQRYLIKPIWGSAEEIKSDKKEEKEKPKKVEKFEKELSALKDALMDSNPEPCTDCDKGKAHAHNVDKAFQSINVHDRGARKHVEEKQGEDGVLDMRHELDNIGSTKPLRSDVDVMFDKKKKHKHNDKHNGL